MASPISGDKLPSALDMNSPQAGREKQSIQAPDGATVTNAASKPDSLQLSHSPAQKEARPPNENLTDTRQANNALQNLLANMQKSPEQALQAQAQIPQSRIDALMSAPIT